MRPRVARSHQPISNLEAWTSFGGLLVMAADLGNARVAFARTITARQHFDEIDQEDAMVERL